MYILKQPIFKVTKTRQKQNKDCAIKKFCLEKVNSYSATGTIEIILWERGERNTRVYKKATKDKKCANTANTQDFLDEEGKFLSERGHVLSN